MIYISGDRVQPLITYHPQANTYSIFPLDPISEYTNKALLCDHKYLYVITDQTILKVDTDKNDI